MPTMTPQEFFEEEIIAIQTLEPDVIKEDDIRHLFMRKNMHGDNNVSLAIYDTHGFYKETKEVTDLFSVDFDTDEVYLEILKHHYEKKDYEYTVVSEELPYINMPWRNGISFIGRVIVNGEVKYKGTITLQYDGTRHYVIIVKPWQVNYATFSQEDPLSLAYNALDPAPFVFEDLISGPAEAFSYPTVLGVIPYNIPFEMPHPGPQAKHARTFSSFDKYQYMFLRPYFAIPKMPQLGEINPQLFSLRLNIRTHRDTEGENFLLSTVLTTPSQGDPGGDPIIDWQDPDLLAFLFKVYDLTNSHNQVIRVSLVTEAIDNETIESSDITKVPIDLSTMIQNITEVLQNLQGKEEPLEYIIDVTTSTTSPTSSNELFEYRSDIRIKRTEPITDLETGEVEEYRVLETTNTKVWSSTDQSAQIQAVTRFEGMDFITNLGWKAGTIYDVENYRVTVTVDAELKLRHVSTGTTQPIMVRGERLIDPNEMLKNHRLKEATMIKNLDRFALLYGPHMGSNFLQFLAYDQMDHAPFPFGVINFDSEIVHIHNHRNNLYVFTTGGLYILHDGFTPIDMKKTFAYANINLDHSEKNTVVSFGNEVFYISRGVGYSIRTNVNVESQDDVYVQPVTQPIGELLRNPAPHIKLRLEEGYGRVIDAHDDLRVSYYTKASNSELYIFATYYVGDESIMVSYIFNKDHRRWTMYDTLAGAQPIVDIVSSQSKGFDLVLKNHLEHPYTTYASYIQMLPKNFADSFIGDIRISTLNEDNELSYALTDKYYALAPLSIMVDTGALSFNPMHTKKVKRILTTLLDMKGDSINMFIVPHIDYKDYQYKLDVEVAVGESDEYKPDYIEQVNELGYSPMLPIISPKSVQQQGFRLSIANLETTRKLSLLTQMNARGKLPGFRFYVFANDQFKIGDYGIVYRQQKAR